MKDFHHLHQHSEYSLLDGMANIKKMVKQVKSLGASNPCCAITDHGTLHGAVTFFKYATEAGVKPIIGYEAYVTETRFEKIRDNFHLTMLAKNFKGYQNLCRLSTISYTEGFYHKPRIDHDLIRQYHEGIIVLSGCLGSELQQAIMNDQMDRAHEVVQFYLSVFKEDYFIEIQNHGIPEQQLINPILVQLAKQYGIGMVITNDGHYIVKEDAEAHDALLAVQTKSVLSDEERWKFSGPDYYLKSVSELEEFLPRSIYGDEAYDNTIEIANRCNVELPVGSKRVYQMPHVEGDPNQLIKTKTVEGIKRRYGEDWKQHIERTEYEMKVIISMGFADYFLIVANYINWAKDNGIAVGPGRGSSAGSIVAYALGITSIDPVKYGLIFERFLNPDRVSLPDADTDFSDTGRQRVIQYVIDKYGADKVAQISTFGTMSSKACLKDVGKVFGIDFTTMNSLTNLIPVKFGRSYSLQEAFDSVSEIRNMLEMRQDLAKVYEFAMQLEGTVRTASVHASGIVIGRSPLTDLIPLKTNKEANLLVSQYDMKGVEEIGLVKMDFLGLRTLTFLENAKRLVGDGIDLEEIPLDDPKVYELLSSGHNSGIFQLEGGGISAASKSLKPRRFEDIVALTSLYRPGPMENIPRYVERHHGREAVTYPDFPHCKDKLDSILKETYGIPVYQEQIMQIAAQVAGYTLAEADLLRRAMGKKDHNEMDKQKISFTQKMKDKGYPEQEGKKLFELLEKFADYGFNKSHAAAYSILSYQTAWFKVNFPTIFITALLTTEYANPAKVAEYISEARRMGIQVFAPDINKSEAEFSIYKGDSIYFGLSAIKSLGENAVHEIIAERRKNGRYTSLWNFCSRLPKGTVNSRALAMLIRAGGLDSLGDRAQMVESIGAMRKDPPKPRKKKGMPPVELVAWEAKLVEGYAPYTEIEKLDLEKEAVGFYISGFPIDYYPQIKGSRSCRVQEIEHWIEGQPQAWDGSVKTLIAGTIKTVTRKVTKSKQSMAVFKIEDETSVIELVMFSKEYGMYGDKLKEGETVLVIASVKVDGETLKAYAKRVVTNEEIIRLPKMAVFSVDLKVMAAHTFNGLVSSLRPTSEGDRLIFELKYQDSSVEFPMEIKIDNEEVIRNTEIYFGLSVDYRFDQQVLNRYLS